MACEDLAAEVRRIQALIDGWHPPGGKGPQTAGLQMLRAALGHAQDRLRECEGGGYTTRLTLLDLTGSVSPTSLTAYLVRTVGGGDAVVDTTPVAAGGQIAFKTTAVATHGLKIFDATDPGPFFRSPAPLPGLASRTSEIHVLL